MAGAACEHDSTPVPVPTPPIDPSPRRAPDSGCDDQAPLRLQLSPDSTADIPYLDQIVACTDRKEQFTLLTNNSDAAWTITTTAAGSVTIVDDTLKAKIFRGAVAEVYAFAVLAPGTKVSVNTPPSGVTWTFHPRFSVMWLAQEQLADKIASYGEEQLTDMLSGRSARRRAVVTCGLQAYGIAKDEGSGFTGSQRAQQLVSALGVGAAVSECASSWKLADQEALQRWPRARTATWSDDVMRLADDARFLKLADDRLTLLSRIGKAVGHLRG